LTETVSASGEQSGDRIPVVLFTRTFKIDGSVAPPDPNVPILKSGEGLLVVYDCKVYDRLQGDKFVYGAARMEVLTKAVEICLPRKDVTKEGIF